MRGTHCVRPAEVNLRFSHKMNLNVLLITGGHDFDRDAFFAMWRELDGVTFQNVQYPEAESFFTTDRAKQFDAFVFYDFAQTMSAGAKNDLLQLLKQGKGLVFLHHSIHGHEDWPEYPRIVGGAWVAGKRTIDGRVFAPSQYFPNQHITVQIAREPHPVTQGLQDFEMVEETYKSVYVNPGATPLLTTTHPNSEHVIGWAHRYEQSRVVGLQPGHGATAFNDPNYRRLVRQAIQWVSGN